MTNTNNVSSKKGFTMIELIFVIVIIGILAAVAIPRLAATRDDAKLGACATDVATALTDLTAYYTSQGKFSSNIKDMTNVALVASTAISTSNDANGTKYSGTLTYTCQDLNNPAVVMTFNSAAKAGRAGYEHNLTVEKTTTSITDPLDNQLVVRLKAKNLIGSHKVGGMRVVY